MSIKTKKEAEAYIRANASKKLLGAIALYVSQTEVEGDWVCNGEESYWEEDGYATLMAVATSFRKMAEQK